MTATDTQTGQGLQQNLSAITRSLGGLALVQAVFLALSFVLLAMTGLEGLYRAVVNTGLLGALEPVGATRIPLIAALGIPGIPLVLYNVLLGLRLLRGDYARRAALLTGGAFVVFHVLAVLLGGSLSLLQWLAVLVSGVALVVLVLVKQPEEKIITTGSTERQSYMPQETAFVAKLKARHQRASVWQIVFLVSTLIGLVALVALFLNVLDTALGTVAVVSEVDVTEITDGPLEDLTASELSRVLGEYAPRQLGRIIRDELSVVPAQEFGTTPLGVALGDADLPADWAALTYGELIADDRYATERLLTIIGSNMSYDLLYEHVVVDVIGLDIIKTWSLTETLFEYDRIETEFAELVEAQGLEHARLEYRSWLSWDFITSAQSSFPEIAGVRTAIVGTLWIMVITMAIAFPLGVGAAIYLEEYAQSRGWLDRVIETNIRNLAGVPSIIYGLLGLAIFVRALESFTSGSMVGITDSNGRTIISASFTLALLILPVIIIASQEAIRSVPQAIREASYGLGATKWQTIRRQILPAALPGILTGTIISMSRAIGETAPLIVVGASAVIFVDPNGPFSKFTALPIQIWQWTARPQDEFRNIAAAAIIVLLGLLIILNSAAIILRQRLSTRL